MVDSMAFLIENENQENSDFKEEKRVQPSRVSYLTSKTCKNDEKRNISFTLFYFEIFAQNQPKLFLHVIK